MDAKQIVDSTQEQAVAAWIDYLNQVRLDCLVESLQKIGQNKAEQLAAQAQNLSNALLSIDKAISDVSKLIVTNRGGKTGIHGYIAEAAQVGIGNARSQVLGGDAIYNWRDDNGQWDLTRTVADKGVIIEIPLQVKFRENNLSLTDLLKHLEKYPDSLEVGGRYLIPKDYYEKIQMYLGISESVANKMPNSTGGFSLREWKFVQEFVRSNKIPMDRIEPSDLAYKEVQVGKISDTFSAEKERIATTNHEQNKQIKDIADKQSRKAYIKSKPSISEGAKATAVSAAVEGASSFCTAIITKCKTGKKLCEFSEQDWIDICGESMIGTLKGGVRGISIYTLTNITATPAAVASALTTASFGIANQIHQYRHGQISKVQLIDNSELLCLDTAVSALSSIAGQVTIPVPILGAVIGNAVGSMMYQIAKNSFESKEQDILRSYLVDIDRLKNVLNEEYTSYIEMLNYEVLHFLTLVHNAFHPNIRKAFEGSIALSVAMGIADKDILRTNEDIDNYFLS